MDREIIQQLLKTYDLDMWLFTDYHGRDRLSKRLLQLSEDFFTSRRWIYIVPKSGPCIKIVSRIEKEVLHSLEGETYCYTSFDSFKGLLKRMLSGKKVAMQYVQGGKLPVISTVDAGFIELVQEVGGNIYSAGDLIQHLWAVLSDDGLQSHKRAGEKIRAIRDGVYQIIREGINKGAI